MPVQEFERAAFDVGEGRVLFVLGQEFYADDNFPNSDFSLATVLGPGNAIVDEIFTKSGVKLEPERRIARDVKDRLTISDHLEAIDADLGASKRSSGGAREPRKPWNFGTDSVLSIKITRASGRRRDRR